MRGGGLRGAGNKGRGEVEWNREQREGGVRGAGNKGGGAGERRWEQRGGGVEVVNLEDCHSALGVRG